MEFMYHGLYQLFECPNIRLKKPSWLQKPSPMTVFSILMVSYFLVTGGVIYDIINEPPSVGSETDAMGRQKPVAIMAWRINGQYIMEGLASSFLFTLGGLGFIILDRTNDAVLPKMNRVIMIFVGCLSIVVSFFTLRVFMRIKMPSYMN